MTLIAFFSKTNLYILLCIAVIALSSQYAFAGNTVTRTRGTSATLTWSVSGANSCLHTFGGTEYPGSTDGLRDYWRNSTGASGSWTGNVLAAPGTYTFVCTEQVYGASDSATLTITDCPSGTSWNSSTNSCATTTPTPVFGDIKANNLDSGATCTIPSGGSNCTGTISWSTTNAASASVWYTNDGVNPGSGTTGSFTVNWMRYGANNFKLCNGAANCSTSLDTVTLTGQCASGTTWNGSSCAAIPSGSCAAQSKTWLTNCSGSTSASSNGGTSVVSNTASGYTGSATYTCSSGTWTGPTNASCTATSGSSPSAEIAVGNCYISAGASTCSGTVTWTSSNLTATPSMQQNGDQFSTAESNSTGVSRTLQYGNPEANRFNFIHDGTTLDTNMGTGLCATGTTWNGSICAGSPPPPPPPPPSCEGEDEVSVVGNNLGTSVWGTSFYTSDSDVGSAAVHYGLIAVGQSANITRIFMGYNPNFIGSTQNGVTSQSYGSPWCAMRLRPSQPELTAGTVSDVAGMSPSGNVGSPITLYSYITNRGTNTFSGGFTNLFQAADSSTGTNARDIGTYFRGPILPAGEAFRASFSYTPTAPGPLFVRACADKSNASDATGTQTESNENNNCGAWTEVYLTDTRCTLPWGGYINNGQSVTAYNIPSVTEPDTCALHSETRVCNNGTLSDPSGTGAYTYGSCASTPPAPPVTFLNITPRTVPRGGLVKMNWSISNPTSQCRITAAVHRPTTCNTACETERSAAESALNNTLERGKTNDNDPYGATRNMTGGNGALTKAVSGTSAKGEKSVTMNYTTTFTLGCGATSTSSKVYIYVSDSNEG